MKRILAILALLAASCGVPELAFAQPISTLTRATSTTGLNDSTLWSGLDSASRVRAFSLAQFRKGLSRGAFDSVLIAGPAIIRGGAGSMTVQSGSGASSGFTFKGTTSGSALTDYLYINPSGNAQIVAAQTGSASLPTFTWNGSTGTGAYRFGVDTIGWATAGVHSMRLSGGATATLAGGAGNFILLAGTGASRTLTLQTTTSGSAVKNTLVLGADSSVTALGTLSAPLVVVGSALSTPAVTGLMSTVGATGSSSASVLGGQDATHNIGAQWSYNATAGSATAQIFTFGYLNALRIDGSTLSLQTLSSGLTSIGGKATVADTLTANGKVKFSTLTAEGSTKNSVCIDGTTHEVLENAAASCLVSSARYKRDIRPLTADTAWRIVSRARPITFAYKAGGEKRIGPGTAEAADSIDHRLASFDAKGQPNSVNVEAYVAALLVVARWQQVQMERQQGQLDSLSAALAALTKKPADRAAMPH